MQRYARFDRLTFPAWVKIQAPVRPLSQLAPWAQLDPGESQAIALASELHADLLLVDEEKGRQTARRLGLRTAGILAVLLDAKALGKLPALAPVLDALQRDARFYLAAEVRARVVRLAGETA